MQDNRGRQIGEQEGVSQLVPRTLNPSRTA